jgi:hypothetical protein
MDHSHDLAALKRLSVTQLQARHAELFGETTTARHKDTASLQLLQGLPRGGLVEARETSKTQEHHEWWTD